MKFRIRHVLMCSSVVCNIVFGGCSGSDTTTPTADMQALSDLPFVEDMAERARCTLDEYVQGGACVACPVGTSNAAGDHPDGPDTRCEERVCGIDERVQNGACVRCAPGTLNDPGDLLTGPDTECEAVICRVHHHVQDNRCEPCLPGTSNTSGDNASGENTQCEVMVCDEDERVQHHQCVECPPGTRNAEGDDASKQDTQCDVILCGPDQQVSDNACVPCASGSTNMAGDDASGPDTRCDGILCPSHTYVFEHMCIGCPPGTSNEAGDNASGANTMCFAVCRRDEYVIDQACAMCPEGKTNQPGDDPRGPDSTCDDTCIVAFGKPCEQLQTDYLKASNFETEDHFGRAVALSGDTLVVGAPSESSTLTGPHQNNSLDHSGAAYVFVRDPLTNTWSEETILKASNGDSFDEFGSRVDISGDTIVVSAMNESSASHADPMDNSAPQSGAVYVFERDPLTRAWTEQAYLKASNASFGDNFGFAVAIDQDTISVGAFFEDGSLTAPHDIVTPESGAVYVFERDPLTRTWVEQAYLKASQPSIGQLFGYSTDVSGDTIIVGAPYESNDPDPTQPYRSGAVYLFVRDSVTNAWVEQTRQTHPDLESFAYFGTAVSISGDLIVVSAPQDSGTCSATSTSGLHNSGSAYVFMRDSITQTWSEQACLRASNADEGDRFGHDVSISAGTIIVTSTHESSEFFADPTDNFALSSGAVYVFAHDPGSATWSEQALIKASNADHYDYFGESTAISGRTLVVGAPYEDGVLDNPIKNSELESGAVYTFEL